MSRAEELVKAVQADPELQSKLSAATSAGDTRRIVTDAGFGDVSSHDVQALGQGEGELSDSELAAASGAGGWLLSQTFRGPIIDGDTW